MAITNIQRNYNEDEELYISAQIDGVPFENITGVDKSEETVIPIGSSITRNNSIWVNPSQPWLKSVNAVDIDWNGAKPGMGEGENGINTTGELLSILKSYASNNEKINWDEVDLSGSGLSGLDENISYIGSISQLVDLLGAVYEASQSPKAHLEQNGDNQTLVFN